MDYDLKVPLRIPKGRLKGDPLRVDFYRNRSSVSKTIRLFGSALTHVTLNLDGAVYEVSLDHPSGWYPEAEWYDLNTPVVTVHLEAPYSRDLPLKVAPFGRLPEVGSTISEYFRRPVFPMAFNCLTAPRNILRLHGRNCDAVSPDQLLRQLLDFKGTLPGGVRPRSSDQQGTDCGEARAPRSSPTETDRGEDPLLGHQPHQQLRTERQTP